MNDDLGWVRPELRRILESETVPGLAKLAGERPLDIVEVVVRVPCGSFQKTTLYWDVRVKNPEALR